MNKNSFIQKRLGEMHLSQKVGQMMVFGFCGPIITPDIRELITKYRVGGLRISQKFRMLSLADDIKPGTVPDESILRSLVYPSENHKDYSNWRATTSASAFEYAGVLDQHRALSLERD